MNNSICVNIEGFWFSVVSKVNEHFIVNTDAKALVSNYAVFKATEARLIQEKPSCRGEYLVVDDKDSRFLHKTEDHALRGRAGPHSFVGRIGAGELKEEILVLGASEKPPGFVYLRNQC